MKINREVSRHPHIIGFDSDNIHSKKYSAQKLLYLVIYLTNPSYYEKY